MEEVTSTKGSCDHCNRDLFGDREDFLNLCPSCYTELITSGTVEDDLTYSQSFNQEDF